MNTPHLHYDATTRVATLTTRDPHHPYIEDVCMFTVPRIGTLNVYGLDMVALARLLDDDQQLLLATRYPSAPGRSHPPAVSSRGAEK